MLAIVVRSCVSEHLLSARLGLDSGLGLTLGELAVTAVFVVSANALSIVGAVASFVCAYAAFIAANRRRVVSLARGVRASLL